MQSNVFKSMFCIELGVNQVQKWLKGGIAVCLV